MPRRWGQLAAYAATLSLILGLSACKGSSSHVSAPQETQTEQRYSPQAYQGKLEPDDYQWVRPAKDYASTRYSTLDQINAQTVKNLRVAWTFDTGTDRGQEAAPLVVNNTMYVVTPWPNLLYALDLTRPGGAFEMEIRSAARRRR